MIFEHIDDEEPVSYGEGINRGHAFAMGFGLILLLLIAICV